MFMVVVILDDPDRECINQVQGWRRHEPRDTRFGSPVHKVREPSFTPHIHGRKNGFLREILIVHQE